MTFLDKLAESNICLSLKGKTKDDVLRELVGLLKKSGAVTNEAAAYKVVVEREAMGSTGLGGGVAIPHAKTTDVADIAVALGVSPAGVDFDSLDGKPVRIFFLILANPASTANHIEVLSEIAKSTHNGELCNKLITATSVEEALRLFRGELR